MLPFPYCAPIFLLYVCRNADCTYVHIVDFQWKCTLYTHQAYAQLARARLQQTQQKIHGTLTMFPLHTKSYSHRVFPQPILSNGVQTHKSITTIAHDSLFAHLCDLTRRNRVCGQRLCKCKRLLVALREPA